MVSGQGQRTPRPPRRVDGCWDGSAWPKMDRPGQIAAQMRADAELWRRVPWLVLLATCGRDHIPTVRFGSGWNAIDLHVGGTTLDQALIGQWPLHSQNAYVDCRTGQLTLISIDLGGEQLLRSVPAGEADIERIAGDVGALLDPRPLLAIEAAILDDAEPVIVKTYIEDFRITPRWHRPHEALDGADGAMLALARSWTGSIAELVEATELLAGSSTDVI